MKLDTYLGGALSAMTTIIYTGIVENRGGDPESTAFTINVYSDVTDMSNSFITCRVPSLLSMLNTLPIFPIYMYLKEKNGFKYNFDT
jgi:hypothetical protein